MEYTLTSRQILRADHMCKFKLPQYTKMNNYVNYTFILLSLKSPNVDNCCKINGLLLLMVGGIEFASLWTRHIVVSKIL
jgi:hypothetical protein